MNKLTKKKAQDLIKRELGISATKLEKPPAMNGHPEWPWYELDSGNLRVTVSTKRDGKVAYVLLWTTLQNSGRGITEYFYADTLEYAAEATELEAAEVFWEKARDYVDNDVAFDSMLRRAGRAYQEANHRHFGG